MVEPMVEFGILLAGPSAEEMGDRHEYYRDLLSRRAGVFRSAWVSDHLMKDDRPILEAWTALTYLAAEFPGYTWGNLVLAQSYRNPALLAKMAATFSYLAGGRLVLGIGAGWQADEYAAYGYDYPSAGTRLEQLGEAIDILRAMWSDAPASYTGKHYSIANAYCEPRPATPIPILVGGHRPKLMQVAADKADLWQWDGPIDRYRGPFELLRARLQENGRGAAAVRLSTSGEVFFPDDPALFPSEPTVVAISAAQDPSGAYAEELDWVMGPTPEDAIAQLRPLIELGVTHVTLYFHDRRSLERFADEVVPAFS